MIKNIFTQVGPRLQRGLVGAFALSVTLLVVTAAPAAAGWKWI